MLLGSRSTSTGSASASFVSIPAKATRGWRRVQLTFLDSIAPCSRDLSTCVFRFDHFGWQQCHHRSCLPCPSVQLRLSATAVMSAYKTPAGNRFPWSEIGPDLGLKSLLLQPVLSAHNLLWNPCLQDHSLMWRATGFSLCVLLQLQLTARLNGEGVGALEAIFLIIHLMNNGRCIIT